MAKHAASIVLSPEDLAQMLTKLRYDKLAGYLDALHHQLCLDAQADAGRNRPDLAKALRRAADAIWDAGEEMAHAGRICKPFNTKELDA